MPPLRSSCQHEGRVGIRSVRTRMPARAGCSGHGDGEVADPVRLSARDYVDGMAGTAPEPSQGASGPTLLGSVLEVGGVERLRRIRLLATRVEALFDDKLSRCSKSH
jgi:hypothetical protein